MGAAIRQSTSAIAPALVVPGALGAAALLVLAALRNDGVRRRLVRRLGSSGQFPAGARAAIHRARGQAASAVLDLAAHAGDGASTRAAWSWAAVGWLLDATVLWCVFVAVGSPLPLAVLVVGYFSANLLNTIPEVTPGGIGVYEAAMAATYIALGVPAVTAVVGVLVYRLVAFWLPVAIGIVPAVRSLAAGPTRSRTADMELAA